MQFELEALGRMQGANLKESIMGVGFPIGSGSEGNEYQKCLVALLAELRQWPTAPTAVTTDLLSLPEVSGHVYFVVSHA